VATLLRKLWINLEEALYLKSHFRRPWIFAALFAAVSCYAPLRCASAQSSEVLLPAQSAAKAKQIIQQAIEALGGSAYMNVHDVTCTGNLGQFDHSGQLSGFEKFIDYSEPPLKDRTENLPQHNEIDIFNGDQGWTLDRGGVSDESATQVAQFQGDLKKSLNNILRRRINEPDMDISYGGPDIVELKQVDWVQLIDSDNRTIRIAFDQATHLPIQETVQTRDPEFHVPMTEVDYFSEYYDVDGIQTPKQVTRERNGMKVYQVFFDKRECNSGIEDSFFTKQSLDERWAKMPNHEKYHDKNKKNKTNDAGSDTSLNN
jgi:hypothetical protein